MFRPFRAALSEAAKMVTALVRSPDWSSGQHPRRRFDG